MRRKWTIPVLLVAVAVCGSRSARAEEVVQRSLDQRSFLMTVGLGDCLQRSGRFSKSGAGSAPLPVNYLEANFQFDLWRPSVWTSLGASAFAAASTCVDGGILGGTVRIAQPWDERGSRWTGGLGPSVASDGAIMAEADVALELRSKFGFAGAFGAKVAVALNHAGDGQCYADTCDTGVTPGSYLLLFRWAVGLNL
jgi:hypothetical protein